MNLRTMSKQLLREIRIDSTAAGSQPEIDTYIAIIDAMNEMKKEGLWYNKAIFTVNTVNDQYRYALPSDYLSMCSDPVYISTASNPVSRFVLAPASNNLLSRVQYLGTDPDQAINSGTPNSYSIDASTNELLLMPIPYASDDQVEFQYVSNYGIPKYEYTGSAWAFYYPESTVTLLSTFTNAGFVEAYQMIFCLAAYNLLTGPYGGTEAALVKSTEYIKRWAKMLQNLRGESTKRAFVPAVRMHI